MGEGEREREGEEGGGGGGLRDFTFGLSHHAGAGDRGGEDAWARLADDQLGAGHFGGWSGCGFVGWLVVSVWDVVVWGGGWCQ